VTFAYEIVVLLSILAVGWVVFRLIQWFVDYINDTHTR